MPDYSGSPPGCHPECVISTECPTDKACLNQKCSNPCVDVCGINTECRVINHSPVCSCKALYTGDPFTRCNPLPRKYSLNYLIRLPIHVYCYCHNIFNFQLQQQISKWNHTKTLVFHLRVDLTLFVKKLGKYHHVRVCRILWEVRQIVDRSASLIQNVYHHKPACNKNVKIRVKGHVEQEPYAQFQGMYLFVLARKATQAMLSVYVCPKLNQVRQL